MLRAFFVRKRDIFKVCRSNAPSTSQSSSALILSGSQATLATAVSKSLSRAVIKILIYGEHVERLIDSGSSKSFIHPKLADKFSLRPDVTSKSVVMASSSFSSKTLGSCTANVTLNERTYPNLKFTVLPELCADVILGQDFQCLQDQECYIEIRRCPAIPCVWPDYDVDRSARTFRSSFF